jgi:hypothetical protein
MTDLSGITAVSKCTEDRLNDRQLVDHRNQREDCLSWLLTFGLDPEKVKGYARGTVKHRAARMDQFYRWVWDTHDGCTAAITTEHADGYMEELATQDNSNPHKAACQKALQMLLAWRHHEHGLPE